MYKECLYVRNIIRLLIKTTNFQAGLAIVGRILWVPEFRSGAILYLVKITCVYVLSEVTENNLINIPFKSLKIDRQTDRQTLLNSKGKCLLCNTPWLEVGRVSPSFLQSSP